MYSDRFSCRIGGVFDNDAYHKVDNFAFNPNLKDRRIWFQLGNYHNNNNNNKIKVILTKHFDSFPKDQSHRNMCPTKLNLMMLKNQWAWTRFNLDGRNLRRQTNVPAKQKKWWSALVVDRWWSLWCLSQKLVIRVTISLIRMLEWVRRVCS